jgi:uncharacterized protein (DUF608 family)
MRKCNCSGTCGPQTPNLTRREFIELLGAGTAATLLAGPAWGAFELPADELKRWLDELFSPGQPRRYDSDTHQDARMHLGGIGTGNFEVGVDGQFTTWQLFNTLRDGQVPFYFAVKSGNSTKLLQTAGGPDWPRVKKIEMSGEYPMAHLRFHDPELPVELELSAFSPFAPLDERFSSMPLAIFIFRLHNPTAQSQSVSLAAFMQNPVGYDGAGDNTSRTHPSFGSNVNEPVQEGRATGICLRAEPAADPRLDTPVAIYTMRNLAGLRTPPPDRPKALTVELLDRQPPSMDKLKDPAHTICWFEEPTAEMSETLLGWTREAVQAGATLVFSGKTLPLLETYATWTGGKPVAEISERPDIVFEDFERGYENWKVQGEAFGPEPAHGTLPNQNPVSGFQGKGLVNTYFQGDDTTGKLTSKPFTIERRFIRFLIGGGSQNTTQIRLLVDGRIVRASAGKDNERLEPALWDVSEFKDREAHLEIVDEQTGGWGHINVDQIEFSDLPAQRGVMALLEELLPARFASIRPRADKTGSPNSWDFEHAVLQPGATQAAAANGLHLVSRPVGKGKVVVATGSVLPPGEAEFSRQRQLAYAFLCGLVGANYVSNAGAHAKAPGFGTLTLTAIHGNVTLLPAFEEWSAAWESFTAKGRFLPPARARGNSPTHAGCSINGSIASTVTLPAAGTQEVAFLVTWHYPNKYSQNQNWMGCHYATIWPDARAVLREATANFATLRDRTERFRNTCYDSTLPYWLLDCLTANAAIARHIGVVFRIANGDVYGWEGSNGCCDPTCTHVWGYEQAFARLFPSLEKEMRRIDFRHQQRPDGGVNNRTEVPSPPRPTGEKPFADGHASCILKAYREALNHPDDSFLREYWPPIHKAVEYLIGRDSQGSGGQPTGILQDDQWNTYDEALHGVTTFIGGYYLAALRAGEAWASRIGDGAAADRFRGIFEKGQKKLVELCWNGEYFQQHLPDYLNRAGEVGPGCMADQLIGQWWAHQLGLGYILPKDKVVSSLNSIFKYNFKSDLSGWKHAPRAFAGVKDKGLIVCTWPKGGRPKNVMLYSDEVWTGIEYQVAAHMIYEGLLLEGFAVVRAARNRYDGKPRPPILRNPWNEIECGGHYARAMSSWSLLLALSGWNYDGPQAALQFAPRYSVHDFKALFVAPEAWGSVRQTRQADGQHDEVQVREGRLKLSQIELVPMAAPRVVRVEHGGRKVEATTRLDQETLVVTLKSPIMIAAGQNLMIHTL